ncbi:MAG TPA: hypothetical protein VGE39_25025 [Prosthecobacter sp.]
MSSSQPRLRMFAGPNGSGKSSLKAYLPPRLLGVYLNADDIELSVGQQGRVDLNAFGIAASEQDIKLFFAQSRLVKMQGLRMACSASVTRMENWILVTWR